jgi:hypothetical protein
LAKSSFGSSPLLAKSQNWTPKTKKHCTVTVSEPKTHPKRKEKKLGVIPTLPKIELN